MQNLLSTHQLLRLAGLVLLSFWTVQTTAMWSCCRRPQRAPTTAHVEHLAPIADLEAAATPIVVEAEPNCYQRYCHRAARHAHAPKYANWIGWVSGHTLEAALTGLTFKTIADLSAQGQYGSAITLVCGSGVVSGVTRSIVERKTLKALQNDERRFQTECAADRTRLSNSEFEAKYGLYRKIISRERLSRQLSKRGKAN